MAGWDDAPTGKHFSSHSRTSKLILLTAAADDGGFSADTWAPEATATGGGDGFDDDTGYIGQNVSKHAGVNDEGCRK
jgi:hypothetical protein